MKADAASPDDSAPDVAASFASLGQSIGTRNLLIVIVTMPLVFLLVVMGAIAIFGKPGARQRETGEAGAPARVERLAEPALMAPVRPIPAGAAAPLVLPSGADIAAMALDGDRLVLRLTGPGGGALVVYDLAAGAVIQRIPVLENPAGAPDDL